MIKLLAVLAMLYAAWLFLRRPTTRRPSLDEREARAVLGVDSTADADAIRAAHRRLLGTLHPDRGGSAELTRRVNDARDVLLPR